MPFLRRILCLSFGVRIYRPTRSQVIGTFTYMAYSAYIRRGLCTKIPLSEEEVASIGVNTKLNITKQIAYRGRAASAYQESLINDFIASNESATCEEWKELIDKVLGLHYGVFSEINIDGKVVDCCAHPGKLDLARSYLAFMKSQNRKFNGAVVSAFIKTCFNAKDAMLEQDFLRIVSFTDYLRTKYPIADPSICDSIVKGFTLQKKLDESMAFLRKSREMCNPQRTSYSAIAICSLENRSVDEARKFIHEAMEVFEVGIGLHDDVYIKWIDLYRTDRKVLDDILYTFRLFDYKPSKLVCDHLIAAFRELPAKHKLLGHYGSITNRGKCNSCEEMLTPVELDHKSFAKLRSVFLENVLVNGDIFKQTTPAELEAFFHVVHSENNYDVVIDGLNVAYMTGSSQAPTMYVRNLRSVIMHYKEQDMRCFLIGRSHMQKWPEFREMLKDTNTKSFFIQDQSKDDPYMLYATMYKGINTMFVTRDLFRSETYKLQSEKDAIMFKRWQQGHQIFITYVSPTGKVYTRTPITCEMMVQPSKNGGWHIPYVDDDKAKSGDFGMHRKWMCLTPS